MANNVITRWIRAVFDRDAAKRVENQMTDSLASAGKRAGEGFLKELRAAFDKRMADLKVQLARGIIDPAQFKQLSNEAAKQFNTGLVAGMDKARAAGTLTEREYLKLSRTLKKVGDDGKAAGGVLQSQFAKVGAFVAATFGARQVVDFIRGSVAAGIEAEGSIERLRVALGQLGIGYDQVSREAEEYFSRLQETTRFSDDDAREALTSLVTITGDYKKSLSLLSLTADVAAKRHVTMAEAAETVGKAALGSSKGMADLGIKAGETGDILGKLRTNAGGFAESEGRTFGGRIQTLNNLWDEFKEKIGLAVIGSDGLGAGLGRLRAGIVSLTEWVDKNGASLGRFLDRLVGAAEGIAKVSGFIIKYTPNLYTASKAWDWLTGKTKEAGEATAATTEAIVVGAGKRRVATAEEQAALAKLLEEGGAVRERLTAQEVATLQRIRKDAASGNLTLAKEQETALQQYFKSRQDAAASAAEAERKRFEQKKKELEQERSDLLRLRAAQESGTPGEFERVQKELKLEAERRLAVGTAIGIQADKLDRLTRSVQRNRAAVEGRAAFEQDKRDRLAGITFEDEKQLLKGNAELAESVEFGKARRAIEEQIALKQKRGEAAKEEIASLRALDKQKYISDGLRERGITDPQSEIGQLTSQLLDGDFENKNQKAAEKVRTVWTDALNAVAEAGVGAFSSLADGGIKSLLQYAKAQSKLLLAESLAAVARGIAALAFGPLGGTSAKQFFEAAGVYASAAVAFGGVASFSGGSGGSGSAGAASGGSVAATTDPSKAPGADVTIILTGHLSAMDPQVQEVVRGAAQGAQERYGENTVVRVVGGRAAGRTA